MKAVLLSLALFAGQSIPMQSKPVVRLKPHTDQIQVAFGGSLLELTQAPQTIYLPPKPPRPGPDGILWTLDVRNFGPEAVTVADRANFSTPVAVNQTIHIISNGSYYSLKH